MPEKYGNVFDDKSASHTVRNIHSNSVCIATLDTANRGQCQVNVPNLNWLRRTTNEVEVYVNCAVAKNRYNFMNIV